MDMTDPDTAYAALSVGWEPILGQPVRRPASNGRRLTRVTSGRFSTGGPQEKPRPSSWGQGLLLDSLVETIGRIDAKSSGKARAGRRWCYRAATQPRAMPRKREAGMQLWAAFMQTA